MKTLLRGGYVVSGRGCRRADVLIDGEKVEMHGPQPPSSPRIARSVDVTGCMLSPALSTRTRTSISMCATPRRPDDFESGSKKRHPR